MSRLRKEREAHLDASADGDDGTALYALRPRPRRSLLRGFLIVLALGGCGVAGYYLADSVYLASQRPAPAIGVAATPAEPAATTPGTVIPSDPATPGEQASVEPSAPVGGQVATPTARRIGSWTLVCPGANSPRTDCALVQRLVDGQKRPVLVVGDAGQRRHSAGHVANTG